MDADAVTVRVVREHDAASFVDYGGNYGGGASGNPFLTPAPPRTPTPTRRDDYERRKPSATTTTLMDSVSSRADARPLSKETRVVSRAPSERLFPSPLAGRAALATARPPGPR